MVAIAFFVQCPESQGLALLAVQSAIGVGVYSADLAQPDMNGSGYSRHAFGAAEVPVAGVAGALGTSDRPIQASPP